MVPELPSWPPSNLAKQIIFTGVPEVDDGNNAVQQTHEACPHGYSSLAVLLASPGILRLPTVRRQLHRVIRRRTGQRKVLVQGGPEHAARLGHLLPLLQLQIRPAQLRQRLPEPDSRGLRGQRPRDPQVEAPSRREHGNQLHLNAARVDDRQDHDGSPADYYAGAAQDHHHHVKRGGSIIFILPLDHDRGRGQCPLQHQQHIGFRRGSRSTDVGSRQDDYHPGRAPNLGHDPELRRRLPLVIRVRRLGLRVRHQSLWKFHLCRTASHSAPALPPGLAARCR